QSIAKTDTDGGGLVAFADSDAAATLSYDSQVFIGARAAITAGNELRGDARADLWSDVEADANAGGLAGFADASALTTIGAGTASQVLTFVGTDARLAGDVVNLDARTGDSRFRAR